MRADDDDIDVQPLGRLKDGLCGEASLDHRRVSCDAVLSTSDGTAARMRLSIDARSSALSTAIEGRPSTALPILVRGRREAPRVRSKQESVAGRMAARDASERSHAMSTERTFGIRRSSGQIVLGDAEDRNGLVLRTEATDRPVADPRRCAGTPSTTACASAIEPRRRRRRRRHAKPPRIASWDRARP